MVSALGPADDPLSQPALDKLQQRGIDTRAVQRNAHETGRVIVDVDPHGKPTYTFSRHPAWDYIEWNETVSTICAETQAVCFGTLAQRAPGSRATIQRFLSQVSPDALKVFDVNLRVDYWTEECICQSLQHADILKLNDDELPIVARACGIDWAESTATEELQVLGQTTPPISIEGRRADTRFGRCHTDDCRRHRSHTGPSYRGQGYGWCGRCLYRGHDHRPAKRLVATQSQ